jgi:hypothetical protein
MEEILEKERTISRLKQEIEEIDMQEMYSDAGSQ